MATAGALFVFAFLIIGLFGIIAFFSIMIRVGNTVRELRKLNIEFNKFFRWMYDKDQKGGKKEETPKED